ncbi:MAG: 30S ribosomal protein S16 [Anaerolineae bacterium]
MLRIRLRRVGAKKQPSYRIVVAERSAPRDGRFVEAIGFYNPRTEPETVRIDEERALHWLSVGAQPSDSVARIFRTHGTMARFERLRAGESLDSLIAEAQAEVEEAEADVEAEVVEEVSPPEAAVLEEEAEVAEAPEAEEEAAPEEVAPEEAATEEVAPEEEASTTEEQETESEETEEPEEA